MKRLGFLCLLWLTLCASGVVPIVTPRLPWPNPAPIFVTPVNTNPVFAPNQIGGVFIWAVYENTNNNEILGCTSGPYVSVISNFTCSPWIQYSNYTQLSLNYASWNQQSNIWYVMGGSAGTNGLGFVYLFDSSARAFTGRLALGTGENWSGPGWWDQTTFFVCAGEATSYQRLYSISNGITTLLTDSTLANPTPYFWWQAASNHGWVLAGSKIYRYNLGDDYDQTTASAGHTWIPYPIHAENVVQKTNTFFVDAYSHPVYTIDLPNNNIIEDPGVGRGVATHVTPQASSGQVTYDEAQAKLFYCGNFGTYNFNLNSNLESANFMPFGYTAQGGGTECTLNGYLYVPWSRRTSDGVLGVMAIPLAIIP